MTMAQPRQDGIEEMLNTNTHRELHFVGSYWALDYDKYGQFVRDELSGNGFSKRARHWADDVRAQLGFKPLGKK
jgi:hypothetical protein